MATSRAVKENSGSKSLNGRDVTNRPILDVIEVMAQVAEWP